MSVDASVDKIIEQVGGTQNVKNVWHCMTRLRFDLVDLSKANVEELKKVPGVLGVANKNGELQIVVGTEVDDYYRAIAPKLGLDPDAPALDDDAALPTSTSEKDEKNLLGKFMDTVSGIFGPIVPAIAGAGMIKGLMAGLAAIGVISQTTDTYIVLDMIASGVFTFLPFFVAYSAARIFKTNGYLAVALAAAMQYPSMTDAAAAGQISQFNLFGFLPVPVTSYAGTVIPIILCVWALSYIWRFVDKHLPKVLRTVFTPTISLFVAGILSLVLLGPIANWIGDLLGDFIRWTFTVSPIFAGIIFGAVRPISVFMGIHHAMTPIALQNFATQGWDNLMPMMFMANLAMTGATFAMYFRVSDANEKSVVVSASISGLLGITEPALFGVLSKYRKAFVAATIGSALSSALIAVLGVRIYGYILSSIFSLVAYIGPYFFSALLGMAVALVSSFVITLVLVPKGSVEAQAD